MITTTPHPSNFRAILITILVLVLAFAAAYRVNAQEQQDPRLKERLRPGAATMVTAIIDSTRSAGIPAEPLIQKALQGAAKGAADERIANAVRRLAGDLNTARGALGTQASVAELEAGASAIHAGAKPVDLAKLRKARPRQPLVIALATLSDLVSRGVPVDVAATAVTTLVSRGAQDDEIIRMQRAVDRDINAGVAPASAAVIRSRNVPTSTTTAPVVRTAPASTSPTPTTTPVRKQPDGTNNPTTTGGRRGGTE
jgi:hypothetical protein